MIGRWDSPRRLYLALWPIRPDTFLRSGRFPAVLIAACLGGLWPRAPRHRCEYLRCDPIDAATRQVAAERMPEIVAIQEHQRKQTRTFLRSDRLSSRLAMRLLPLLAKSGLAGLLVGKRLRALQHGVVPVRLTA